MIRTTLGLSPSLVATTVGVYSVVAFGAKADGITSDSDAIDAALQFLYANTGGILRFPYRSAGYALSRPVVIDLGRFTGGGSVTIELCGNTFLPSHNGWCFDIATNYFGSNNGGALGKKLINIIGGGAVVMGLPGAAGGMRATDTIGSRGEDIVFYNYTSGVGLQLAVSSTHESTWNEECVWENIRACYCLTGISAVAGSVLGSFLGTTFRHCVVEGKLNNSTLFSLAGGFWNSAFVQCGGFYNQNGTTGGRGFYLDGSYNGTTFVSCWIDTGVDSNGQNSGAQSGLSDIVFGPNYTTDQAWQPTFIGCNELNLPQDWRNRLLAPGPFPFNGSAAPDMSANPREVLRGLRTYFVSNTGSDATGTGLSATSPFATVARALQVIYQTIDCASFGVELKLLDGTYTTPIQISGQPHGIGSGSFIITGNLTTPGAVTISTSSVSAITLKNGATVTLQGVTLTTTTHGYGLQVDSSSTVSILGGCQFGGCADGHVQVVSRSSAFIYGDYKITGPAPRHWAVVGGSLLSRASGALDATGIAFSGSFAVVGDGSQLIINGGTFVTSNSTGSRFYVYGGSIIQTYGGNSAASRSRFPGDQDGFVEASTFGVYS